MEQTTPQNFNIAPPPVQSPQEKTLYNSSYIAVFFRNFLAGLARGLGSIFIYLIFLSVATYFFQMFIYPQLAPVFNMFKDLGAITDSLGSPMQLEQPEPYFIPEPN